MRKVFVLAFVALLVMLAVSCDSFNVLPGGEKPEYTADGERLVELSVKVGGTSASRALTLELAQEEADFMEVIFTSGGKYYRKAGFLTEPLKIRIPAITYDATNAILLIGRSKVNGTADNTLLAIGTCSQTVSTATSTITFSIKSLKAELYAGAATPSFVITATNAGFTAAEIINGSYPDNDITCFQVKNDQSNIGASLTISGFDGAGAKIVAKSDPVVKFTGTPTIAGANVVVTGSDLGFSIASNAAKIAFTFNTNATGLSGTGILAAYVITFDVPVVGFAEYDTTAKSPSGLSNQITWHLRGGTTDFYQTREGGAAEGVALIVSDEVHSMSDATIGPLDPSLWQ